jgi:dGTPase
MEEAGGFDHNAHTIRLLTRLESPYPLHSGLNLTWETLEGLAKHNGPVSAPGWALAEADREFPLDLASWPGLEAQVAAVADDIAYDNHDIDDGLRAGLFALDDLLAVPFVARHWQAVLRRYPDVAPARLVPELIRDQIGWMVNDVLEETKRRVAAAGVESVGEVRAAGRALAGFSPAMAEEERALKAFLYARMYRSPPILAIQAEAKALLAGLFGAYRAQPGLLPVQWRPESDDRVLLVRRIGDFIAGMTDRYAIARYRDLGCEPYLPELF